MNSDEQADWIARIEAIRQRAAERIESWRQDEPEEDLEPVHDQKDQSESLERSQLRAEQIRVEQQILDAAVAARRRVDDHTFGVCLDCDQPIAHDRLLAMPTALRCVACQRLADRHF